MAITTVERNQLVGLFVAMTNAAPGTEYLAHLVSSNSSPLDLKAAAEQLASDEETADLFNTVYPSFLTAEEFADRVIDNLLTSDTPAGAKAWATDWIISKVNSGESFASVLADAAWNLAVTTNTNYASAQAQLLNKVQVANYYSVVQGQPSTDLASLQDVIDGVTADAASVDAAKAEIDNNLAGETFVLTKGVDTFKGTTGADTFNAQSIETVVTSFDSLDGGKGNDTLNIYAAAAPVVTNNPGDVSNVSITNIETINIFNDGGAAAFGAVDASVFVGATAINQIAFADAVTELAAGTVAGFKGIEGGAVDVTVADDAATAAVALEVDDATSVDISANADGVLDTITITGTVSDAAADGVDLLLTDIELGDDVEALTLTTAVGIELTVTGAALTAVDASASTGDILYYADTTVADIATGAGDDEVGLATVFTADLTSASLSTGAGDDQLVVDLDNAAAIEDAAATIDAGEGDDQIEIVNAAGVALTVLGGAGDDEIFIGTISDVTEDDLIDGGEGNDLLVTDGGVLVAEDYIILDEVLVGFDAIEFTAATTADASRMTDYKDITFTAGANVITKVAADQVLTTSANLDATAAGYVAGATTTYAGTLDITATATSTITAKAETVNLTVEAAKALGGGATVTTTVTLVGDAKTATIELVPAADNNNTKADTSDDVLDVAAVVFDNTAANLKLTTLTLTGNGTATVTNADGGALVTVDASALNSVDVDGEPVAGLAYTSDNTKAETIKLGGGIDSVDLTGSTVKNMDTIHNLNLVDEDEDGVIDPLVDVESDVLVISDATGPFVVAEITAGSLNLALTAAAQLTDDAVVFHFGGNTYIYEDVGPTADVLDDTDLLVKIVGTVDLDLLAASL